jgi:hypothetical protein
MDARHHPRAITDQRVTCHALGRHFPVLMYDLSTGGCMFEASGMVFNPGERVAMAFAGVPETAATVVWAAGKCVGVKFCSDLQSAVVENYGGRQDSDGFDAASPRDRFGRPLPALNKYSA